MNTLVVIAVVMLVVLPAVAAVAQKGGKGKARTGTYRRRTLMTDNELEFFGRLVAALPDHLFFLR